MRRMWVSNDKARARSPSPRYPETTFWNSGEEGSLLPTYVHVPLLCIFQTHISDIIFYYSIFRLKHHGHVRKCLARSQRPNVWSEKAGRQRQIFKKGWFGGWYLSKRGGELSWDKCCSRGNTPALKWSIWIWRFSGKSGQENPIWKQPRAWCMYRPLMPIFGLESNGLGLVSVNYRGSRVLEERGSYHVRRYMWGSNFRSSK